MTDNRLPLAERTDAVKALRRLRTNDDGNMLLALLLSIMVMLFAFVTAGAVVGAQVKSRHARDFSLAQQAIDVGVNDALMRANQQDLTEIGRATELKQNYACNPASIAVNPQGTVNGISWRWCAVPTPAATLGNSWDVTITASAEKVKRVFKATLSGVRLADGTDIAGGNDGHVRYRPAPQGSFAYGFFADKAIVMRGNDVVKSYDSASGAQGTGNGRLGTNGTISLDTTISTGVVNEFLFWDWAANPNKDRCVSPPSLAAPQQATPCETVKIGQKPIRYEVSDLTKNPSMPSPNKFIDDACAAYQTRSGNPIKPWIASKQGHNLLATDALGVCYSSLIFDDPDTPVTVTGNNPVYVTGDISVSAGQVVNVTRTETAPDALSLTIYSKGQRVTIDGANFGNKTRVAWALWAPNASCAGTTGNVDVYGVMLCSQLHVEGGWSLYFDDQIASVPDPGDRRGWSITRYEEQR